MSDSLADQVLAHIRAPDWEPGDQSELARPLEVDSKERCCFCECIDPRPEF